MHGYAGCYISGFIMYTVGLFQINLSTVISIERFYFLKRLIFIIYNCFIILILKRFYIIYKPLEMKRITFQSASITIIGCMAISLFFTTLPLLGWSHYSLELSLVQCGIEWAERSWNVQSYNMVIFLIQYFIPAGIIIFCSCNIIIMVYAIFLIS
jgi:hypothetical protein